MFGQGSRVIKVHFSDVQQFLLSFVVLAMFLENNCMRQDVVYNNVMCCDG